MTANDAETLLRTYADALEAAHPPPAHQTGIPVPFIDAGEVPIPTLELPLLDSPAQPRTGRHTTAAFALAAVLALVIGFLLLDDDSDVRTGDGPTPSGFVFDGEVVIREDPLVVIANQPDEPMFDTSDLGTRIVHRSPFDVDEAVLDDAADRLIQNLQVLAQAQPDAEIEIKKIALYAITEGQPIAVTVADFPYLLFQPNELEGTTRLLSICSGDGGCSLDTTTLDPADDLSGMRPPSTYAEHVALNDGEPGFSMKNSSSDGAGQGTVMLEVSLDIAVVQLTTEDQQFWTVPIDGLAVLSASATESTPLEIVTYDESGGEVTRETMTIDPSATDR